MCGFSVRSAHDNDVKEANKTKSTPPHRSSSVHSQTPTSHLSPVSAIQRPPSSSTSSTPQLLFQPDGFPHLSQHSPSLSQLQVLADSQALGPIVNVSQDFLQSHRMGLLTGAPSITPAGGFSSYPSLTTSLQQGARAVPLQGPISVQMALAGEPRHCLSMAYSGGYLGAHHTFTAGCFDRWRQETEREHKPLREYTAVLPSIPTPKHPLTDLLSLSVGTTTPSAGPTSPSLSQRRLRRKQRSKGKTDPVEVITLTWQMLHWPMKYWDIEKMLCHILNWFYTSVLLWDCHHCEWDESSHVIQHPPHSVPVLSCVIAEPILEVYKDILLLDILFISNPKKWKCLREENWLVLFLELPFRRDRRKKHRPVADLTGNKKNSYVWWRSLWLCFLNVSKLWTKACRF